MFLRIFAASFIVVAALQWTAIRPFLGLPDYRGCDARGYNDDRYLAFCDNSYGAYDAGGIYLDLESVQKSIRAADVVILGNSRAVFGFSTEATDRFSRGRALLTTCWRSSTTNSTASRWPS